MSRDLLHAYHHFDGNRASWLRFNESICNHLSGLICKQGMTCNGVISGEPQNVGGMAQPVVASGHWRKQTAWTAMIDSIADDALQGFLRSTFGSGLNAIAGGPGPTRRIDPHGAWLHLLAILTPPSTRWRSATRR